MNLSKTSVSGYIGGFFTLLAICATVPTELQAMIMATFPKLTQPYVALFFAIAAFAAKAYQSKHTQDVLPTTPPDTTQTTVTVTKETVATNPNAVPIQKPTEPKP